jgi:serine/threonine protein phosphatase 1
LKRTLAIGDIHGCLTALDALLDLVAPDPDERLITLGDYVDRGPDSRGVLDRLIALYDAGRLVPLRGNHDEMMVVARDDPQERPMWLRFGGVETLESYDHRPGDDVYDRVPERHWQFLERELLNHHETADHIFVHATARPDVPLADQDTMALLWHRLTGPIAHVSGKRVICGHTRQDSGYPLDLGSTVCIDTAIYEAHGWLTCLDVGTGQFWQANQRGDTRIGSLDHLRCLREQG